MAGRKRTRRLQRDRLIPKQDGLCIYCQNPMKAGRKTFATRDHVIPKVDGGGNGDGNIVMACATCNVDRAHIDATVYLVWVLVRDSMRRQGKGPSWRLHPRYSLHSAAVAQKPL